MSESEKWPTSEDNRRFNAAFGWVAKNAPQDEYAIMETYIATAVGNLHAAESSLAEVKEQVIALGADRDNPKAPWWNTLDMIRREREEVTRQLAEVKADRLQRVVEVVSLARDDAEVLQAVAEAQVRELSKAAQAVLDAQTLYRLKEHDALAIALNHVTAEENNHDA